jgi:hypothetical protein
LIIYWHCGLLPFILIEMQLGVSCLYLHALLNQIAVLVLVQFFFGVLVLVYLLCLLGTDKLNVLLTVHHSISVQ